MFKISTRRFVIGAMIAALYMVFTIGLAPISYGVVQFRVSEFLKVFVLFDPFYALWIGVGTLFANMASPFAGPWDLIWMPFTDAVGGIVAYFVFVALRKNRKLTVIPMAIYAITTGASVGLMLMAFGLGIFWALAAGVILSELIILITSVPLVMFIVKVLEARGVAVTDME